MKKMALGKAYQEYRQKVIENFGIELLCKHVLVPLCYKAKNWIDSKKAKDEPIEAEATEVVETDEE